jgi:hypothetical protein
MAEIYEADSLQKVDIARYLDIVRRRHIHFLIPLFLGWLVVWGCSWLLSPNYKSSTLILVEEPTMPRNYVTPNVDDDLQARLQSMQQQILSRTRLLMIVDSLHLYDGGSRPMSDDDKVAQMRKEIKIELVRGGHHRVPDRLLCGRSSCSAAGDFATGAAVHQRGPADPAAAVGRYN